MKVMEFGAYNNIIIVKEGLLSTGYLHIIYIKSLGWQLWTTKMLEQVQKFFFT